MKKIVLIIGLVAFIGAGFIAYSSNTFSNTSTVQVDNEKCPHCGKENCDGSCKTHKCSHDSIASTKTCNHDAAAPKACCKKGEAQKSCCKKGETSSTAPKSCCKKAATTEEKK